MAEHAENAPGQWLSSGAVRTMAGVASGATGCAIAILTGSQQASTTSLVVLLILALVLAITWPLTGWRASWLALGAVMILLLGAAVTVLDQRDLADALANGCLFLLFAASVGEILVRRIPYLDDGGGIALRGRLVVGASETVPGRIRRDYVVVGLVCAVASQTWTDLGSLLAFGDFSPLTFLNPDSLTEKLLPLWNTFSDGLGGRNFTVVNAPLLIVSKSMNALGVPGWMTQRLILTALFTAQGLCMVYLLRTVWPRSRTISRVAGALFYVFNMQALFTVPGLVQMTGFLLLPLLAAFMLKGFASRNKKYVVLFGLSSVGLGYVAANPPLVLVVGFGATLIAAIFHACSNGSFRSVGRFLVRAVPLVLALNLWWLVPLVLSLGAGGATHLPVTPQEWEWTHVRNSVSNLYSLNSNWAWPQKIYYPYSDAYGMAIFQFGAFVPAGLAFGALATSLSRRRPAIAWLSLASILLLFVGKGLHEPFREVNEFLLTEVPGMWVLREPASKLLPIVVTIFGILICACLDSALSRITAGKRRPPKFLWRAVVLCGVVLPILAFPLLSGQFAWAERPVLPDARVSVPDYWHEMAESINEESSQGAILLLPLSDFYAMPYIWGYYGPDSVPIELIHRPTITGGQLTYLSYGTEELDPRLQVQSSLIQGDYAKTRWLLRSLGIRYVLIRGDIDYEVLSQLGRSAPTPDLLTTSLEATSEFQLVDRAGPLMLYKTSEGTSEPVSAWSDFDLSDDSRLIPGKGSLYSRELIATVNEEEMFAENEHLEMPPNSHSSPAKVILPIRRGAEGVEAQAASMELLWEKLPPEELKNTNTYLRLRDGELQRFRFHDGQGDLRIPWGYATVAEFWSTRANLLSNSSFEHDSRKLPGWEDAEDCGRANKMNGAGRGLGPAHSHRSTEGRKSLQLSATDPYCVFQSLSVDPLSTYEISLDHAMIRGKGASYCVFIERGRRGSCLAETSLAPSSRWASYRDTFVVPPGVVSVDIAIHADRSTRRRSTVVFDDVQVREIELDRRFSIDWRQITASRRYTAETLSVWDDATPDDRRVELSKPELPQLRVVQASQSGYVIDVSNAQSPFMLTLNQTFDPAWTLSTGSGEDLDATHVVTNGYANGWWVERTGNLQLVLTFPQEKYAFWARWISLVSVGSLICLAAIWQRKAMAARLQGRVRTWRMK